MNGPDALARVTLYALGHDEFRQAWEAAVRDAADKMAATIANAVMHGEREGDVRFDAAFPGPLDMDDEDVVEAFRHAVTLAVGARMETMKLPGELS